RRRCPSDLPSVREPSAPWSLLSCRSSAEQGAVEERDHAPLVLPWARLEPARVEGLRNLPERLGLTGGRVELWIQLLTAEAVGRVDKEHWAGRDPADKLLQV